MADVDVNDAQLDQFPEKGDRARQLETLTMLGYSAPFRIDSASGLISTEATSCLKCGAVVLLTRAEEGQPSTLFPLQIHEIWHKRAEFQREVILGAFPQRSAEEGLT